MISRSDSHRFNQLLEGIDGVQQAQHTTASLDTCEHSPPLLAPPGRVVAGDLHRASRAGERIMVAFCSPKSRNMVNAIKGLFISCDVPMAQFIVNLNASMPASDKFILHMLDPTHMFVQPHVAEMIRGKISEFRDQNSFEKPT
uniref:General transcription and DNA repair factor IIH subunit TFB5 n=1 Tax=Oryza glaberrima TaxID=4538 RepID=I1PT75_ORYGL